jgi:hypothetical protein
LNAEFDGIVSTFAGLNTARDLRPFAKRAAELLRPGGVLFVHMLNRWPALDILRRLARLNLRYTWHIWNSDERDVELGGRSIRHYLYSPLAVYQHYFSSAFLLERVSGQGIFRPVESDAGRWLEDIERRVAAIYPFFLAGTFFSLEMVRRPNP